jgi:hypothetical protein
VAVRFAEFGGKAGGLPRFSPVITGLDPVIHAFIGADPDGGSDVDGRIKSGHDDCR